MKLKIVSLAIAIMMIAMTLSLTTPVLAENDILVEIQSTPATTIEQGGGIFEWRLIQGYNAVSTPMNPDFRVGTNPYFDAQDALELIDAYLVSLGVSDPNINIQNRILGTNPSVYDVYTLGDPESAAFEIKGQYGYFVEFHLPGPYVITFDATCWKDPADYTLNLEAGCWNFIGYPHKGEWDFWPRAHNFTDGSIDPDLLTGGAAGDAIIASYWIQETQKWFSYVDTTTFSGMASKDWEWRHDYSDFPGNAIMLWATDPIEITFPQVNKIPIAEAGSDQIISENGVITLDGSLSSDTDGNIVSYFWDIDINHDSGTDGITDNDIDATGVTPSGNFWNDDHVSTVQLTVTDDEGATAVDTMTVIVLNTATGPDIDGVSITPLIEAGKGYTQVTLQIQSEDNLNWIHVFFYQLDPVDGRRTPVFDVDGNQIHFQKDGDTATFSFDDYYTYEKLTVCNVAEKKIKTDVLYTRSINGVAVPNYGQETDETMTYEAGMHFKLMDVTEHVVDLPVVPGQVNYVFFFDINIIDPGSDDLFITWDLGDGTVETFTLYNDGVGDDLVDSPYAGNSVMYNYLLEHDYASKGTYSTLLTITDDDGGVYAYSLDVIVE
ncbi:MAG: hypothetical protein KAS16_01405 [Thermoplasmata archaeon]|nr:hypothetical protein [Thermoplasmata archaeon]